MRGGSKLYSFIAIYQIIYYFTNPYLVFISELFHIRYLNDHKILNNKLYRPTSHMMLIILSCKLLGFLSDYHTVLFAIIDKCWTTLSLAWILNNTTPLSARPYHATDYSIIIKSIVSDQNRCLPKKLDSNEHLLRLSIGGKILTKLINYWISP